MVYEIISDPVESDLTRLLTILDHLNYIFYHMKML